MIEVYFILILLSLLPLSLSLCSISKQEYSTLYDLYNSTNGKEWRQNCSNWSFNNDYTAPCTNWTGIICNARCQVIILGLSGCKLSGTIIPTLGNLSQLTNIDFSRNNLEGTIPSEIILIQRLTDLVLDYNRLTGSIPTYLGNWESIKRLFLSFNSLSGTLPSNLANIDKLEALQVNSNKIQGTIPIELGNISTLKYLMLYNNKIQGTLPTTLGKLSNLLGLNFQHNPLSGNIPTEFGNLLNLLAITLAACNLTGTVPIEIAYTKLIALDLSNNYLTGTIPTQLAHLHLTVLDLSRNSLIGNIPTEIVSIKSLIGLYLFSNSLTGSVPEQLLYIRPLNTIDISNNLLTGTISSKWGYCASLYIFDFSGNGFMGTIPTEIGNMSHLFYCNLAYNSLTGSIPSQLGHLNALKSLSVQNCLLTGTIPSSLIQKGRQLILSNNLLTGTIASPLFGCHLSELLLYNNMLTGSIPEFANCEILRILYLQDNRFYGSIPSSIFSLPSLRAIDLSNNTLLSGFMDSYFNINTTQSLRYITLSNLAVTGTLPDMLFQLQSIETIVLSSTCICGVLPASICRSNATYIILNGIGTGLHCKQRRVCFHGKLPSCTLSLPSIDTLQLAGNGFTGLLPDLPLSSTLKSLNLARNRLKGDIPLAIQKYNNFSTLDISSNRITGVLIDSFQPPSTYVNLTVNRISGKPPSTFRVTHSTINVCDGNLLGCPLLSNDISNTLGSNVSCGSRNIDTPFCVFLMLVTLSVIVLRNFYTSGNVKQQLLEWLDISYRCIPPVGETTETRNLALTRKVINSVECACSISLILTLLFLTIVVPVVVLLKKYSSGVIYQEQYLYTATTAYLVGLFPAALVWCFLSFSSMAAATLCILKDSTLESSSPESNAVRIEDSDDHSTLFLEKVKALSIGAVVVCAAVAVNYGFVDIVYFNKPQNLTLIQFAFAIVKYLFGSVIVPYLAKIVPLSSRASFTVSMTILVNVAAPGIAVLLKSPLCLLYLIRPSSTIATYKAPLYECEPRSLFDCRISSRSVSSTFIPQWYYSYQCSSSFLTSYLPNFVYLYIINGIFLPIGKLVLMLHNVSYTGGSIYSISCPAATMSTEMTTLSAMHSSDSTCEILAKVKEEYSEYCTDMSSLMPSICFNITIILTFGLASPLLAAVISISTVVQLLLLRLALGRYIKVISSRVGATTCYKLLESAFSECLNCLSGSWFIISSLNGIFWSFFINDMIGDTYPNGGIVAAVLVVIWCPLIFALIIREFTRSKSYESMLLGVHQVIVGYIKINSR